MLKDHYHGAGEMAFHCTSTHIEANHRISQSWNKLYWWSYSPFPHPFIILCSLSTIEVRSNVASTVLSRLLQSFGWGNILIGVRDTALTSSFFVQNGYTKKTKTLIIDFLSIPYQLMCLSQPQFVFPVTIQSSPRFLVVPLCLSCLLVVSPSSSHDVSRISAVFPYV